MDRRVVWTTTAADDLEAIAAGIAADAPSRAASVIRDLVGAAESLSRFPRRGRRVPEYDDSAVRELIVHDFRLIYQVAVRVTVLRVIHGARELPPQ